MSEALRRSTRTVIPVTPFTIDNPAPIKRKRPETPQVQKSIAKITVVPPAPSLPAADTSQNAKVLGQSTSNGVPLTMFSDRSLDSVIRRKDPAAGNLLRRDLEELRGKGTNMTVKQLLAKNFKNYRARPSLTSERATEIVNRTLSENDVPVGALLSGPPVIPATVKMRNFLPNTVHEENGEIRKGMQMNYAFPSNGVQPSLQAALESLVTDATQSQNLAEKEEIKTEPNTESGLDEYAHQMLSSLNEASCSLEPVAYPGNHLPWPVFWKAVPQYKQSDIYLHVGDTVYTQMSDVIKAGQFLVPLNIPVPFIFNDKAVEVTLNELLTSNGINLTNSQHFRMLQGLFQKAGVHIRVDYAERLHELQASVDSGLSQNPKPRPPIPITMDKLPLVCKQPDIFMAALGKRLHGAILVDTSGDKPPIPNQTFLTTIYSQPLSFDSRRQILILHDAEVPVQHIADRYQCTVRSILETIGTRVLIERHQIDQHLLENPGTPDVHHSLLTTTATVGEVMRPRNKIRRTHYVDLNKLVWKHFKDCQAQGVQINGKHLKDQAMRYAKEMGLESFRGSEGWLDAFKRRHKIDLKTMTGFPVCYGSEMFDEVDQECRDMSPMMDHHHSHQSSSFLMPSHQEDFTSNFFSTLSLPEPTTSSSTHLQNMINSMMTPLGTNMAQAAVPEPVESPAAAPETFYNVMKSCQIRVADKEVSLALDTIRTFILAHDPAAMNLLVPLQERLARTSSGIASALSNDAPSSS